MAGARRRPQVLGGVEEVHDPHRVREPITVQPPQPFSAVAKAHADVLGRVAERRQFAQQPPRQRRVAAGVVRRALVRPEGALRTTRRPEPSTARRRRPMRRSTRTDLRLARACATAVLADPPGGLQRQRRNPPSRPARSAESILLSASCASAHGRGRPVDGRRSTADSAGHRDRPDSAVARRASASAPTARIARSIRFTP